MCALFKLLRLFYFEQLPIKCPNKSIDTGFFSYLVQLPCGEDHVTK